MYSTRSSETVIVGQITKMNCPLETFKWSLPKTSKGHSIEHQIQFGNL